MKRLQIASVLTALAIGLSGCAGTSPTASEAFDGRCSEVTTAVAQMTMSLSVLPVPGAEFPTTEEEVRQRILDGGWSDELEFSNDLSYADYDLTENQENYSESEKALLTEVDDLTYRTTSVLFPMQDESISDWNKRLEEWMTQILAAKDKLSSACNK